MVRVAKWTLATVMVFHWLEHLTQAFQVWVLHWPRAQAMGFIGLMWPHAMHSEWLHWVFAALTAVLMMSFVPVNPVARVWWNASLFIAIWHMLEHTGLLIQARTGPWFGESVPTSIATWAWGIPRIELHLFYNSLVTVPMIVAVALAHTSWGTIAGGGDHTIAGKEAMDAEQQQRQQTNEGVRVPTEEISGTDLDPEEASG